MSDEQSSGWTGGQNAFGDFAPGMVHYTDKVLFDEVWEREGLSKRDRSLITVAALTAMGKAEQLNFHLGHARQNGVTEDEIKEGYPPLGVLHRLAQRDERDDRGQTGLRGRELSAEMPGPDEERPPHSAPRALRCP